MAWATTTLRPACRAELVAQLRASAGLAGVQIDYGIPRFGQTEDRHIFCGSTQGSMDTPLAHPTRLPRNDSFTIDLFFYAASPGDNTGEDADALVLAMFAVLEDILADDGALGMAARGVLRAGIGSVDGPTPLPTDNGSESRIKATVEFDTRLQ